MRPASFEFAAIFTVSWKSSEAVRIRGRTPSGTSCIFVAGVIRGMRILWRRSIPISRESKTVWRTYPPTAGRFFPTPQRNPTSYGAAIHPQTFISAWQFNGLDVRYLRKARAKLKARFGGGVIQELRRIFNQPSHGRRANLAAWLAKRQASQPKLCEWVEETIKEALPFLRLPRRHHLQMRSMSVLDLRSKRRNRLNQEVKRPMAVVRILRLREPPEAGPRPVGGAPRDLDGRRASPGHGASEGAPRLRGGWQHDVPGSQISGKAGIIPCPAQSILVRRIPSFWVMRGAAGRKWAQRPCSPSNSASKTAADPIFSIGGLAAAQPRDPNTWDAPSADVFLATHISAMY